jgi:large subunit ribosomal protein L25
MATASLSAAPRTDTGKGVARSLRREGKVPGVIYGHARAPQSLAVDARELGRLLDAINAETTVIELALGDASSKTLIREIQRHPVKRTVLHIDFQELVAGELVTVQVPLTLVGTAVGVRLNGGIMTQVLTQLECRCDPSNIPNRMEVDVTKLEIGQSIHVSDIVAPAGVEILNEANGTIVNISAPKQSDDTPAAEGSSSEPEVIRAKKAEDEAEAKK